MRDYNYNSSGARKPRVMHTKTVRSTQKDTATLINAVISISHLIPETEKLQGVPLLVAEQATDDQITSSYYLLLPLMHDCHIYL